MTDDPIRERVARVMFDAQLDERELANRDEYWANQRIRRTWLLLADAALRECGYEEMRRALETMLNGCDRYDDDPESLVAMEAYLSGKERARAALSRTQGEG